MPIRNSYYRASWICLVIGLICCVVGAVPVVLLSGDQVAKNLRDVLVAVPFFSFPLAIGFLFGGFIIGLFARRMNQLINRIRREEFDAHWTYTTEEWEAFRIEELPLGKRDFRNHIVLPLAVGIPLGMVALACAILSDHQPDLRGLLITEVGVGLFFVLVIGVAYYTRVIRPHVWRQKQSRSPPSSYLHSEFIYANGEFVFGLLNQRLAAVQFVPGKPPVIELTTLSSAPRGGVITEVRRILVPRGEEQSAAKFVESMRAAWGLL